MLYLYNFIIFRSFSSFKCVVLSVLSPPTDLYCTAVMRQAAVHGLAGLPVVLVTRLIPSRCRFPRNHFLFLCCVHPHYPFISHLQVTPYKSYISYHVTWSCISGPWCAAGLPFPCSCMVTHEESGHTIACIYIHTRVKFRTLAVYLTQESHRQQQYTGYRYKKLKANHRNVGAQDVSQTLLVLYSSISLPISTAPRTRYRYAQTKHFEVSRFLLFESGKRSDLIYSSSSR